jgi:hypothetical protein
MEKELGETRFSIEPQDQSRQPHAVQVTQTEMTASANLPGDQQVTDILPFRSSGKMEVSRSVLPCYPFRPLLVQTAKAGSACGRISLDKVWPMSGYSD